MAILLIAWNIGGHRLEWPPLNYDLKKGQPRIIQRVIQGLMEISPLSGFPPIREFREIRENFEDFFQSGKSGKNGGFSAKIREKNFKSGNFFSQPFSNLLNL